jgi:hypothetical protein
MNLVIKHGEAFMHLGDKAQFFSDPIPSDITAKELYERLSDLQEAVEYAKAQVRLDIAH